MIGVRPLVCTEGAVEGSCHHLVYLEGSGVNYYDNLSRTETVGSTKREEERERRMMIRRRHSQSTCHTWQHTCQYQCLDGSLRSYHTFVSILLHAFILISI